MFFQVFLQYMQVVSSLKVWEWLKLYASLTIELGNVLQFSD